jgi:hypothetical protein
MTTATTEKPILFSGEMVRAILAGRKTQTRRIVKPQPEQVPDGTWKAVPGECWWPCKEAKMMIGTGEMAWACPYGQVGTRLWVRERWYAVEVAGEGIGNPFVVFEDEIIGGEPMPKKLRPMGSVRKYGCKPSIHMPRWASRITLEVTEVRVERLNDISDADALAEGVANDRQRESTWYEGKAAGMYRDLWERINGVGSWTANPWVWAISFKVVK